MAKVALLVGNATYDVDEIENLSSPLKDVAGLSSCLESQFIGDFDQVTSMLDENSYAIQRKFHSITNRLTKDDTFLFYYSGHGQRNSLGNLNLLASDSLPDEIESSSVDLGNLFKFIRNSATSKVIIILDCCYSGAISGVNFKDSLKDSLKVIQDGSGTYLMTASTGVQTAAEFDSDDYSLFTKYLVEGLESGAADVDRNGVITLDELYDYVYAKVRSTSNQIPTKWNIDCRGVIQIAKSMFVPREERMRKLKPILLTLLDDEKITTDVFTQSLRLAESQHDDLSNEEKEKDSLLEKLLSGELKGLDYIIEWTKLDLVEELNQVKFATLNEVDEETIEELSPEDTSQESRGIVKRFKEWVRKTNGSIRQMNYYELSGLVFKVASVFLIVYFLYKLA